MLAALERGDNTGESIALGRLISSGSTIQCGPLEPLDG
jgi:hypothetical protein